MPSPQAAQAQEAVDVTTQAAPVNMLTINDIDFVHSTTPKWLFTIDMRTRSGGTTSAVMTIHLTVSLADGEDFGGRDVVRLTTKPFVINGTRTLTNLDLRDASLRDSYTTDAAARRKVEETALPSGVVPAGTYTFLVEVTPAGATVPTTSTFNIVLSNPSSLELLFPVDGDDAVGTLPVFQWIYDGPSATIAVYEKLPGQATLEEAANGTPQLRATVTTNSFQYPPSGARALIPGRTYVWYVQGNIGTAGGTQSVLRSPLRSFTVQSGAALTDAALLDQLEQLLDPKYKPLFDEIRAGGYALDGVFRLNGAPLSRADLVQLITGLQGNPDAVKAVELTN